MKIAEVLKYEGDNNTFIWRHPSEDFNILTQLIVHESQEAIFFKDGHALDLIGPGRYTLETKNIPLITSFLKRMLDDQSPFHCEVYFVNKTEQISKWGTDSKVEYIDPFYEVPIAIGASGELSLYVEDSKKLLLKLVGTESVFGQKRIIDVFWSLLMTKIKTYIAQFMKNESVSVFEIDEHLNTFSQALHRQLIPDFADYGLKLTRFFVSNIKKPEENDQYKRLREIHYRKYEKFTEAKLGQKIDLIHAETEAQKVIIDSKAQARKRELEGYTYSEERSFDVADRIANNESIGQFTNIGLGIGTIAGVSNAIKSTLRGETSCKSPCATSNNSRPHGDEGSQGDDTIAEFRRKVEKLSVMKEAGLLSDAEFEKLKEDLISHIFR